MLANTLEPDRLPDTVVENIDSKTTNVHRYGKLPSVE